MPRDRGAVFRRAEAEKDATASLDRTIAVEPHPEEPAQRASRRMKATVVLDGSPGDAKHRPETPAARAPHHEGAEPG